jgi:hypothetical protein
MSVPAEEDREEKEEGEETTHRWRYRIVRRITTFLCNCPVFNL